MATGKRYYWIKLKDSFMSSDAIDYLMSQPDGANYVVLYQMLCLKTINTGGCLVSKIGEMLIPYDVKRFRENANGFLWQPSVWLLRCISKSALFLKTQTERCRFPIIRK